MSEPIELIKGKKRQTVFSEVVAVPLIAEGWQRVAHLTPEQLLAQESDTQELPPVTVETIEDETKAWDTLSDEALTNFESIVPANDVPGAMNQGRLAKGRK